MTQADNLNAFLQSMTSTLTSCAAEGSDVEIVEDIRRDLRYDRNILRKMCDSRFARQTISTASGGWAGPGYEDSSTARAIREASILFPAG